MDGAASAAYNEPMPFEIRGPLDPDLLIQALHRLAARHEALRTRLVPAGGSALQVIDPPETGFPVTFEDLTDVPDAAARFARLRQEVEGTPFRLGEEPMVRGCLVARAPEYHVLLLTAHHIVFDGWSRSLLLRELGLVYAALQRGEDASLPELTWQYSDYSRWQWEWMAGDEPEAHAAYWAEALAGTPPVLTLPTDRPRPPEQDFSGDRLPVTVDEELTSALRRLAADNDVSLYATVLTGWSVLLSLLSGQDDVVVGAPTSNRRRGDVEGLIGFFVNTLALRADLSGPPTVGAALQQVNQRIRDALRHVDLPFERVVEVVNPPRSPAHTALFQNMFAWVPSMRGGLAIPGTEATLREDAAHVPAKFDLVLALADEGERLVGEIDYAVALFDRTTVQRYIRQFLRVLRLMTEHPEAPIGDLTLLDEDERRELLAAFSAGPGAAVPGADPAAEAPYEPAPTPLLERFAAQVRERPRQPAVVAEDGELDYATLDRRANRLAAALLARGAGPDRVVGLHAGRTTELVVGVLGILKSGAAYLPLDPDQPAERLAAMVSDAAPVLVLTDQADGAAGTESRQGWEHLAKVAAEGTHEEPPALAADPERLAYVIYTSGSTGRPKGVAVTHGSVLNLFAHWRELMGEAPGEAASAWSSIGFDASVHELLVPLTTGAVLHLVPDALRGDPAALLEWMRVREVVQAFLPPSYVLWIDEDPAARLAGLSLRQLLTGVEPLPERALHRMREALPGLRVCFGYGPTEATLYATAYTDPQPYDRSCPIGRPLRGTRLYLLDGRMRPVPVGVPGEVHLGGASLARGYLNRADLTDERFLPDPFVPGERIYRTGDVARWLPDGNAEYVGRADDQLKLRGFRIEPGEVEAALLAVPGVREAVVLADRETPGGPHLVAGVGCGTAAARTAYEWRAALQDRLPDYMIPVVVAEFPRLPLNRSGKVDRPAVLRATAEARTERVNTAAPRDHTEMALYRIWRQVLLHPDIGIGDDFFALGGTSISAIKMASAVRDELGVSLPVRDVLLHPTIEALAERVRGSAAGDAEPSSLVEFRAGAGRRRVVCVHPAGGTAFCYLPLSTALPEEVGVVGLQAPGINPGESTLPGVEAMAEEYLRLVRPRADEALVLCGLSYGGLIAYEMGRRLVAAGHEQVSVVLLDTHGARGAEDAGPRAGLTPVGMAEFRAKLVRFNGMYPGIDDDQVARYLTVYNHHRETAHDYAVPESPARVVLMQATAVADEDGADAEEAAAELRAFWRERVTGTFAVEPVACGHWDMLESDELPRVAAVLTAELDSLTTGPDGTGTERTALHGTSEAR